MQSMQEGRMRWLRIHSYPFITAVAISVWIFAGCATDGKIGSDITAGGVQKNKGYDVDRLDDGREGFIIRESPQLDEKSRRDFEHGVRLMNDGEYEQAVVVLEKVIENSPGVSAPYIDMAIACQRLGRLEKAEEYLKKALALVPDHPVACNEYGLLFRRTGRFNEARYIYEKAISRFPEYYPLHRNLGILCDLYLDDQTCALEHYQIYSRAMPKDREVKLWIADLRIRLGQD